MTNGSARQAGTERDVEETTPPAAWEQRCVLQKIPPCYHGTASSIIKDLSLTEEKWHVLRLDQMQQYFHSIFPHSHAIPTSLVHKRERHKATLNHMLALLQPSVGGGAQTRSMPYHIGNATAKPPSLFGHSAVYHHGHGALRWCTQSYAILLATATHRLKKRPAWSKTVFHIKRRDVSPSLYFIANSLPLIDEHQSDDNDATSLLQGADVAAWIARVFSTPALLQSNFAQTCVAMLHLLLPGDERVDNLLLPKAVVATAFDLSLQTLFESGMSSPSCIFAGFFFRGAGTGAPCLEWILQLCRLCDAHGLSARTRRLYVEAHVAVFYRLHGSLPPRPDDADEFELVLQTTRAEHLIAILASMQEQSVAALSTRRIPARQPRRHATGCRVQALETSVEIVHSALKLTAKTGMWKHVETDQELALGAIHTFLFKQRVHTAMATGCGPAAPPTAATACGNAFVLDHLSDEEVEQIAGACVSTFDRAVFSLLRYTALRRRGVCWLRLGDVFDASTWRVLGTGRAREKGGHVHTFQVAPQLASALLAWHADRVAMTAAPLTAGDPLFPSRTDVSEFCTTSELHRWFGAIAARAGLRGAHVHLHAFRKTLVVMLSRLNPLDLVSQWIGHLSTRTTRRYYLNVTAEELNRSMVIPWQRDQPPQGTSESDALIAMYRDRIRTLEQLV